MARPYKDEREQNGFVRHANGTKHTGRSLTLDQVYQTKPTHHTRADNTCRYIVCVHMTSYMVPQKQRRGSNRERDRSTVVPIPVNVVYGDRGAFRLG